MDIKVFFYQYMELIKKKYTLYATAMPEWNDPNTYFNELQKEIIEAQEELKDNNTVYLEDELGDILRDYANLIFLLQKNGKITSIESIMKRSLEKYGERISDKGNGILRKDTKEKQKKKLADEHQEIYGE